MILHSIVGKMTDLATLPAPPTQRDERRQRIIAVASQLFLANGFARTSMSQVAAAVGGSKTTLWSYFAGKNELFMAVADHFIERYFDPVERYLTDHLNVREDLQHIGRSMLAAAMTPEISGLIRISTAESRDFAELGDMFHKRGLGRGWTVIGSYLDRAKAAGHLTRDCDTGVAARHFIGLCQAHWYQRIMLAGEVAPDGDTLDRDVEDAVDTFLRAFAR